MRTSFEVGTYRSGEQSSFVQPYLDLVAATAKRGIVMTHGYQSDATSYVANATFDFPQLLGNSALGIDAGAPTALGSGTVGKCSFGNDDSIAAVGAAVTYLQARQGVKTDKIMLMGISMGALPVLNWARQNLSKVAAIALIIPVLDLQYLHDTAPSQSQNGITFVSQFPNAVTDIQASWGGGSTPPAGYYNTHSPIVYASQLVGIPITCWVSNDDIVTNSPSAPNAFQTIVGSSCSVINCGTQSGIGHNAPCATLPAVGGFLQNYV